MIDLHTHILPGLDDGAQSVDDAIELAEIALESGVRTVVATPHSNQKGRFENYDTPQLRTVYKLLREELKRERLQLQLLFGMEIFASDDLKQKVIDGRLIGLNGTDRYLVEFALDSDPGWIGDRLEDLLDAGKTPLIAHPERYACVQDYPAFVYEWLQMGCLCQSNRGSIFGKFGRSAQRAVRELLENGLVTCVASDAHSPCMRTTFMRDAWEYLEDTYGERTARRLLIENPEAIVWGRPVSRHGRRPEPKRWFY